jgi:hypothetical protein
MEFLVVIEMQPPKRPVVNASEFGRVVESKRFALMAALLRGQVAQTLDDAAEMFVRLMTRMHNRAREAQGCLIRPTGRWVADPGERRVGLSKGRRGCCYPRASLGAI